MKKLIYRSFNKLKFEFATLRFYLISLAFLVIYFVIVGAYLGKNNALLAEEKYHYNILINGFSIPAYVTCLVALLCIIFKLGFLEKSIEKFKMSWTNLQDAKEQRRLKSMSNEEKRAYLHTKEKTKKRQIDKPAPSKFPFVFNFSIYLLLSIIFTIIIYA